MKIKQRPIDNLLHQFSHLHTVLQRVYAARGIESDCQLDMRLQALLPFHELTDIEKACDRLEKALLEQERILVIGDFDADGATSTALAVSALRAFGALHVDFLVPNRFEYGYGLTPGIVSVAQTKAPHLIITVDNGIASIDGVDAAREAGIDVLITDHHLPGEKLPNACAIVNPNQSNDSFVSKSIAGVGVIFYTMLAFRRRLVDKGWFISQQLPEPNMGQFLDLVALGTVADVVALDQNNRILVSQGLSRIRKGQVRAGIKALVEVANRQLDQLKASDLGFSIAPRLNAAGRLDDMSLGINCLLSDDYHKAHQLAKTLDNLNIERRKIESEMKEQALLALQKLSLNVHSEKSILPIALCLVDPNWHQGVIGILAGRLKDRYHRPVITFAVVSDDELKGSARSVNGLNIRDVLAAIDLKHPKLMNKFGGHAMAAGLSIPRVNFDTFRQALIDEVSLHLDIAQCENQYLSDGPLSPLELNIELAELIQEAGPWGQQFPEPLFDNVFEVLDQRLVGQHHLKLTLAFPEVGEPIDAIAFNVDLNMWPNQRARYAHVLYRLDINIYQGRRRLQLMVEAIEAKESHKQSSVYNVAQLGKNLEQTV